MKSYAILLLIIWPVAGLQAQTNRIEVRSRSGTFLSGTRTDNFGKIAPYNNAPRSKPRAADTVKVIKVKPWKPVKDSMPPRVNPVYTKRVKSAAGVTTK